MLTKSVHRLSGSRDVPICLAFSSDKSQCSKIHTDIKSLISKTGKIVVFNIQKLKVLLHRCLIFLRTNLSTEILWL